MENLRLLSALQQREREVEGKMKDEKMKEWGMMVKISVLLTSRYTEYRHAASHSFIYPQLSFLGPKILYFYIYIYPLLSFNSPLTLTSLHSLFPEQTQTVEQ